MKRVLFCAVKNEGPFLIEWIAYHRAIGFDEILIISNDSDDGTTELLNCLHEAGAIRHIYHTVQPKESPHRKAAALANASGVVSNDDWTIWLDADEFLNIHVGEGKVDDLISATGSARGILLNWHIFGDSGHLIFPGRFISPDFTRSDTRNFHRNGRVKTFFRWHENQIHFMESPHRPAISPGAGYATSDFLNGRGLPISSTCEVHQNWVQGIRGQAVLSRIFMSPREDYGWDVAQINHYTVRTRDIYGLKRHRGRSHAKIKPDGTPMEERHTDDFFREFNRNDAEDLSILRHEHSVTHAMADLMRLPGVAAAQEATLRITASRIAELEGL